MKSNNSSLIFFAILIIVGSLQYSVIDRYDPISVRQNDTSLPKISSINTEGVLLPGTNNLECVAMVEGSLFYVNATNNGTLYRINMTQTTYTPQIILSNLGVINDLAGENVSGVAILYFSTATYGKAIMRLNTSSMFYEKVLSETETPYMLGIHHSGPTLTILYQTINDKIKVSWPNGTLETLHTNFLNLLGLRFYLNTFIFYNESQIYCHYYNIYGCKKVITDTGIRSAIPVTPYIIYAQDPAQDSSYDGKIKQYNIETGLAPIVVKDGFEFPASMAYSPTGGIWYWITQALYEDLYVFRLSDYSSTCEGSNTGVISIATVVDKGTYYDSDLDLLIGDCGNYRYKSVVWNQDMGLYIAPGQDDTAPSKVTFVTTSGNETTNSWDLWWNTATDLNAFKMKYELWESQNPDFQNKTTSIITNTSQTFKDKNSGTYYYKVRANDGAKSCYDAGNNGEWSNVINLTYAIQTTSPPNFPLTLLQIGLIVGGGIGAVGLIFLVRRLRHH